MKRSLLSALLCAAAVCLLAIDGRSFWIDEAGTFVVADTSSPTAFLRNLVREGGSTAQMPLFMAYAWTWQRFAPASERILRFSNVPWVLAGIAALAVFAPRRQRPHLLPLALLSPFLWYYLNEYRPYVMQWAGAAMAYAPLMGRATGPRGEPRAAAACSFSLGLVILAGSSLLGMLWAAGAVLGWLAVYPPEWSGRAEKRDWIVRAFALGALGGLSFYYLFTLRAGARGSAAAHTGAGTLAFTAYELMGLAGLGPGRLALREQGASCLLNGPLLFPVAAQALLIFCLLAAAARSARRSTGPEWLWIRLLLALIAPAGILLTVGLSLQFRLLGRHFTPLSVLLLFGLSRGMLVSQSNRRRAVRLAGWLVLAGFAASSLQLRLAPRHAKDDYRAAAALASEAARDNRTVWWAASRYAGQFYGLPVSAPNTPPIPPGGALLLANPSPGQLAASPWPDRVLLSKPDLFDRAQAVRAFLERGGYGCVGRLRAFTIWERNTP